MIFRKLFFKFFNVPMGVSPKKYLFTFLYLCVNAIASSAVFLMKAKGDYLQLVYTLRTLSVWGLFNGLLLLIAICFPGIYVYFLHFVLYVINGLYNVTCELTILFLIMCFISYLNLVFGCALVYGGLNFFTYSVAYSALRAQPMSTVKYYVVDYRQVCAYESSV